MIVNNSKRKKLSSPLQDENFNPNALETPEAFERRLKEIKEEKFF